MYFIGIAGGSGSGKTTFAKKIQTLIQDNVSFETLSLDSYYLPNLPSELINDKGHMNFDHPEAFDWHLFVTHLKTLKDGRSVEVPVYDFVTSSRLNETKTMHPKSVLLIEGIFTLFHEQVRNLLDMKIYLQVDSDIRIIRRLFRDINERGRTLDMVVDQYYETVRPMYLKYLEPQKSSADITVGEDTDIAATLIASKALAIENNSLAIEDNSNEREELKQKFNNIYLSSKSDPNHVQ